MVVCGKMNLLIVKWGLIPEYADLGFDGRLDKYAPFAARRLVAIMSRTRCGTIGVSWGLTPRAVLSRRH